MQLKKIYYLNGTHWDREWYRPFQGFRYMLMDVLDEVIETLENDPEYKLYTLDGQTAVLDDYCQIAPENRERLSNLIAQGRIAVGPWYTMPDEFLISGEFLIRNLLLGHRKAQEYGAAGAMKYGYVCDIFGHIAQLPQLLRGVGIDGALLQRGCNQDTTPPHFIWQAPDGSQVYAYRTPEDFGYGAFYHYATEPYNQGWDKDKERLLERAIREIDREAASLNAPYLVLHDALDHQHITAIAPWLAKKLEEHYGCPVEFVTLDNMTALLKNEKELPVRIGELAETAHMDVGTNILLTYVASSRVDVKQANDQTQNLWEKLVEPLIARAAFRGKKIRPGFCREAYLEMIRCHAHDSICGCSVQDVHRDMFYRYRQAREIGHMVIDDCLRYDVSRIPTEGEQGSLALRVYNSLPYARRETIRVRIGFDGDGYRWFNEGERLYESKPSFFIRDRQGREVPYTLCDVRRQRIEKSPSQYQVDYAEILLPAELQAMGYTDYEIVPAPRPVRSRYLPDGMQHGLVMENEHIRAAIQPDGRVSLTNRKTSRIFTDLLDLVDDADIGDGWMYISPAANYQVFGTGSPCTLERLQSGPGGQMCRIRRQMRLPRAMREAPGYMHRDQEYVTLPVDIFLTLGADDPYLSVTVQVNNTVRDHRLRLCLPTDIPGDTYMASQTFAFLERPIGADMATQSWKEPQVGDRNFDGVVFRRDKNGDGLAFISGEGLHETNALADDRRTLLVTLYRCFDKTIGTNGEDDGELLKPLHFTFRLMPLHKGVTENMLIRCRDSLQAQPQTYMVRMHGGVLPPQEKPFVEVLGDVTVSAIKLPEDQGADELIVRVVNQGSEMQPCTLRFAQPVLETWRTNLLEQPQEELTAEEYEVALLCAPWKIQTIRVRLSTSC